MLQTLAKWTDEGNSHAKQRGISCLSQTKETPPSRVDLNKELRSAIERGDFVRAQGVLEALVASWDPAQSAHPVDTENYDRLLYQWSQRCAKAGQAKVDLAPMLSLLEALVAWNRVNTRSFNTALVACQRVKALDTGERVLEMMKQSGRQPKAFAYTTLMSCCGRLASGHKKWRDHFIGIARRYFEELVESKTGMTIEAVNAMVFVYRTGRGRSAEAVALVERAIREWKLEPDVSTIAPLVVGLVKDKNPLEAARWIEFALTHRIRMDDSIVQSVMDECRGNAHWDQIQSLRTHLQEHGVAHKDHILKQVFKRTTARDADSASPPIVLYGSREGIVSRKVQKKEATFTVKEVIDQLEDGQLEGADPVQLTRTQWTDLFKHSNIDELDKLMKLLLKHPNSKDQTTPQRWFNEMYLRALGSAGQWWRIVRAVDEMLIMTPSAVTVDCFNAALRGCTRAGRFHQALRVTDRMKQANVKRNRQSYDALIQCCGSIGSVEAAIRLFHEMELSSIILTTADLNAVLKAFATAVHRLTDAGQDESTELDVPAFDLNKLAVYSLQFFEEVTSKYPQLQITEDTLLQLFRSFLGAAEVFDAVDMREFEVFAAEDDHRDHKSRADWILLSDAVQHICREAPQDVVSSRVINVGIDFFQRRGEPSSAFELFNTMVSRGISPTSDSIRLLFAACCRGDDDTRLGLFFLDHLMDDLKDDAKSNLSQTIASEALRWAGRMTNADDHDGSALVDTVFNKLVESGGLRNDASIYSRVMAVFGQDGNLAQAQRVTNRMLSETGSVSLSVANRLLQACSVARTPIAALNTLGWMRYHGLEPDVMSYNSVLSAIRRHQEKQRRVGNSFYDHGDHDDTDEEEEDTSDLDDLDDYDLAMPEEDTYGDRQRKKERRSRLETNFNAVIDNLVATMHANDVSPNARTYESLVSIATQRGEMRRVLELFDNLKATATRMQVDVSALLTTKTIVQYLDACAAVGNTDSSDVAGRVEELCALLMLWYRERRTVASSTTILRILQAYDALGQWQDAIAVLKNASDDFGAAPTVEMVQAVMQSCNRAGQHKAAEQIFVAMQKPTGGSSGRLSPTAACYVEAIYAIEQQGKWIDATQLFMEMQRKCASDDLHPALLSRIALGRYAEGRKRPN